MRKLSEVSLLAGRRELTAIPDRLSSLRARVVQATARRRVAAGDVVLVGAAKRQPLASLVEAWDAGLEVFGENRVQEAEAKRPSLPQSEWHLIGPLQSNKAQRAVSCFDAVHSVDRLKIARALDRHAGEAGKELPCFLQVNLAAEASKSGFSEEEGERAAVEIAGLANLRLVGLMAIPPRGVAPEDSRPWFRRLRALRDRLGPQLGWEDLGGFLSMGMSDDFEVAIEEGATHVRIGTALFGPRDSPETANQAAGNGAS